MLRHANQPYPRFSDDLPAFLNCANLRILIITFLNAVTGHRARIGDFHVPLYDNIETFKEDMRVWSEWYESQKCGFTKEKADSLVSAYNL